MFIGLFVLVLFGLELFHILFTVGLNVYSILIISIIASWICFIIYSLLVVRWLINEINHDYLVARNMYRFYSGRNPWKYVANCIQYYTLYSILLTTANVCIMIKYFKLGIFFFAYEKCFFWRFRECRVYVIFCVCHKNCVPFSQIKPYKQDIKCMYVFYLFFHW